MKKVPVLTMEDHWLRYVEFARMAGQSAAEIELAKRPFYLGATIVVNTLAAGDVAEVEKRMLRIRDDIMLYMHVAPEAARPEQVN